MTLTSEIFISQLLIGDFGSGAFDVKMKVFGGELRLKIYVIRTIINTVYAINDFTGTRLISETPLLEIPTAVCTFYIDTTEPHTPGERCVILCSSHWCCHGYSGRRGIRLVHIHLQEHATVLQIQSTLSGGM